MKVHNNKATNETELLTVDCTSSSNNKNSHSKTNATKPTITNTRAAIQIHNSFQSVIDLDYYDGYIIDQWGVMHNGDIAMNGAIESIKELHRRGKKLIILSNTSSSEFECLARLDPLGFNSNWFTHGAVTSGDIAIKYIKEKYGKYSGSYGNGNVTKKQKTKTTRTKALVMAWKHPIAPSSKDFLDRINGGFDGNGRDGQEKEDATIELVMSVEDDPDILIVHGLEVILRPDNQKGREEDGENEKEDYISLGDYVMTGNIESSTFLLSILKECSKRNIPLLCIDPDIITMNPDGSILYMPGSIAKYYKEKLNGEVIYFGKPTILGFQLAIQRLLKAKTDEAETKVKVRETKGDHSCGCIDIGCNSNSSSSSSCSNRSINNFRICHIGDSIHHDIIGANNTNYYCNANDQNSSFDGGIKGGSFTLDTILVLGGVHRVDLGIEYGKLPSKETLVNFFQRFANEEDVAGNNRASSVYPTHIVPLLKL